MERYEAFQTISQQEAENKAAATFKSGAKLYAVLDFAVCFGVYDKKRFLLGLEAQAAPVPLNWNYLQELRIFDEEMEMLLVPSDTGWTGRLRSDPADRAEEESAAGEYHIDECQKLWGSKKKDEKEGIPGWSLLRSRRGTRIQIPEALEEQGEAAILVRKYMRVPDMEKGEGLVYQKDIRMVKLCSWKGDD